MHVRDLDLIVTVQLLGSSSEDIATILASSLPRFCLPHLDMEADMNNMMGEKTIRKDKSNVAVLQLMRLWNVSRIAGQIWMCLVA